jgi:hypothetical protein
MNHYSEKESKDWTVSNMKTYIMDCYYYSDRGGECKRNWPDLSYIMESMDLDTTPIKHQQKFIKIYNQLHLETIKK